MMVSPPSSPISPRCRLLLLLAGDSSSDQGFTMFEVLIALMMSFLFLTGTLNAMVVSAVMQVKAERQAKASYWIQQDLENVRADAAAFTDVSNCSNTPPNVGADYIIQGTTAATGIPPVTGDGTPTTPAGTPISSSNTREIVGIGATLTRTLAASGNVATLNYSVTANGQTLAQLYTEVLPASALTC